SHAVRTKSIFTPIEEPGTLALKLTGNSGSEKFNLTIYTTILEIQTVLHCGSFCIKSRQAAVVEAEEEGNVGAFQF
ncbi:MAG: hypothetical protein Q7I92_06610, partial [Humidesulfovibrio sp.]|nr:hypothetical protein [Humidesulfovibrio sp.]